MRFLLSFLLEINYLRIYGSWFLIFGAFASLMTSIYSLPPSVACDDGDECVTIVSLELWGTCYYQSPSLPGIESIREWQKFVTADCTKCSICQSNMHLKNIHQIRYDHKIHSYYNVYGGRNGQYPCYRASVGATNDGMIALAGASVVAAAFYPYLNMAEGGHGLKGMRNNIAP
nr:nucleotide-binding alpha-beta plait domain-containing protein [Tanacetum cinerariifolium]